MRANRRKARPLHAALNVAHSVGSPALRRVLRFLLVAAVLGGAGYGLTVGCSRLHDLWIEQCVVTDAKDQISVIATPHVTEELVREWFGLTNGCNLALIDFRTTRDKVLREHPIVRDITITRHLPNRVEISLDERKPIARVNLAGTKMKHGDKTIEILRWDVADVDGIVFEYAKKDTQDLPVIAEPMPSAKRGERLSGKARSALRVIELAGLRGLLNPPFPEISTANATYLKATTRNYSTVLIDWRLVDDPSDAEQPSLTQILSNYQTQMNKGLFPDRCTFTITERDRIAVLPNE